MILRRFESTTYKYSTDIVEKEKTFFFARRNCNIKSLFESSFQKISLMLMGKVKAKIIMSIVFGGERFQNQWLVLFLESTVWRLRNKNKIEVNCMWGKEKNLKVVLKMVNLENQKYNLKKIILFINQIWKYILLFHISF